MRTVTPPMPEKSALRDRQIPVDRWHNIIGEPTIADTEMPDDSPPAGARHPADFDRNRWPTSFGMPGRLHRNPHVANPHPVSVGIFRTQHCARLSAEAIKQFLRVIQQAKVIRGWRQCTIALERADPRTSKVTSVSERLPPSWVRAPRQAPLLS